MTCRLQHTKRFGYSEKRHRLEPSIQKLNSVSALQGIMFVDWKEEAFSHYPGVCFLKLVYSTVTN